MAGVSSTGSTTGTANSQVLQLVQQLMVNDRKPLESLKTQKSDLQNKLTVYTSLGSRLSSLASLAKNFVTLDSSNPLRALSVTGNDTSILQVATGSNARAGTYTIEIQQLAARQALTSVAMLGSDTVAAPSSKGSDTADSGAAAKGSAARFRITVGGTSTDLAVAIAAGASKSTVMGQLARAVNNASIGLTAQVLDVGNGEFRLQIQSQEPGSATTVSGIQDLQGTWMRDLGLASASGKIGSKALVQEGAQARILINGVPVSADDNVIKDAIPGLTLTLVDLGTQTITVARDDTAAAKGITDFVSAFNKAVDEIRTQTQPADTNGENRGPLAGNVSFSRLRTVLRETTTRPMTDTTSGIRQLSQLGLTTDREGHLVLSNSKTLQEALESNPDEVEALMKDVGSRVQTLVSAYSRVNGILARDSQTVQAQIRRLDSSITNTTVSLTQRQNALVAQMAQLEATAGALSQQKTYLAALLGTGDTTTSA